MKLPEGIKVDPEIMMGKPCVKGTRIPVYVLLQKMAAGETEAELLKAYPQLSKTDLMAVWEYAARAAAEEIVLAEYWVRLLFDENLSILSAQWAAATLAVDVLDARAAGLAGKTDREVRRFAIETDRILVTLDSDFGNLIRFSPSGTPGVIWLRPRPPTEANIRSILAKWLYRLREINLHGHLAVVEEDKLRIRGGIEE
jgi:uncharacterized protein (DUF433 family)/predicted nuclease of predicted toxin-antitoxin system